MSFRIGDSVIVKQGVKDPDFDADLSHWQGTIAERIDAKHVCIEWDSHTLEKMSHSQIKTCERQGWSWHSIHLELSDIEKSSRRALQRYLWVKTSDSAVGLRMGSPWISSRYSFPSW
jgi:hypothetical protein